MELTTKWKNFKSIITNFINEADDLLYFERENLNEDDCNFLQQKITMWINDCQICLKESFNSDNNEYAHGFNVAKAHGTYLKNASMDISERLNGALDELNTKRKTLEYFLELLSVSDAITQPKLIDLETRATYTKREIQDLLLDKLYHLYNRSYYPVQQIIRGNGLKVKMETIKEITEYLEQKEYIRIIHNRNLLVQLTSQGKKFIEDKRNFDLVNSYVDSEIQNVEFIVERPNETIKPETIYYYYEKQLAS